MQAPFEPRNAIRAVPTDAASRRSPTFPPSGFVAGVIFVGGMALVVPGVLFESHIAGNLLFLAGVLGMTVGIVASLVRLAANIRRHFRDSDMGFQARKHRQPAIRSVLLAVSGIGIFVVAVQVLGAGSASEPPPTVAVAPEAELAFTDASNASDCLDRGGSWIGTAEGMRCWVSETSGTRDVQEAAENEGRTTAAPVREAPTVTDLQVDWLADLSVVEQMDTYAQRIVRDIADADERAADMIVFDGPIRSLVHTLEALGRLPVPESIEEVRVWDGLIATQREFLERAIDYHVAGNYRDALSHYVVVRDFVPQLLGLISAVTGNDYSIREISQQEWLDIM